MKLDNKKIKKRKGKGGCGLRGERDEKNKRKEKKRKVETGLEEGIDGRLSRSFVHAWFSFGCPLPLFFPPVMKANASFVGASRAYLAPG